MFSKRPIHSPEVPVNNSRFLPALHRLFFSVILLTALLSTACSDQIVESTDTVFDDLPSIRATFSSIQSEVFNESCALAGCHGDVQSPNLSAGVSYNNIVNRRSFGDANMDYIEPGNADSSYLFRKITGAPGINGVQMPRNGTPLSTTIIDSIRVWINTGALNN